ncbi:MAG: alginate export family protein [Bacteroidales bacterium]|nr:MAG: alginate export family protein [Bacteroidales bacterium]
MKQMNFERFIAIAIICLFIVNDTKAQFRIEAQYRPRLEFRDGYRKLAAEGSIPTVVISQRTRLSLRYESEQLKLIFTPQDVRVWGDEQLASSTGVYGDNASLDLFEGYAEIKTGNFGWVSVGRQQLVYDRQRLLAARNWNQNGIAYDAVVLKIGINRIDIHVGSTWNSLDATLTDNYYLHNRIKSLNYLWIKPKFIERLDLSFLHIASGVTETDFSNKLYYRQTTGICANYGIKSLKLIGNAYYQYGKNKNGKTVGAFLVDADLAYIAGNLTPGLGISYLSGDKNPGSARDNLFDVLYGARHRYFGHMDYFRNFTTHTNEGGLANLYAYLEYKFSNTLSLTNYGHYFQLAQTNDLTPDKKNLGFENELILKYDFNDWGSIKSEYIFYLPTESFKLLSGVPNGTFSQFFFVELTLRPTLFKQKTE